MNLLPVWPIFFMLLASINAQDYSIPSTWRKPNNTLSRDERIALAQAAVETMLASYSNNTSGQFDGFTFWESGLAWTSLTMKDWVAGTTDNKAVVDAGFATVNGYDPNFFDENVNSMLYWGIASFYAYKAYNDTTMLVYAEAVWSNASNYMIASEDASSGTHPQKQYTFQGTCNGQTLAGGVWNNPGNRSDMQLGSLPTGCFMVLSAYLAEVTSSSQYADAATLSAEFMRNLFLNNAIVTANLISLSNSSTCSVVTDNNIISCLTGYLIAGWSVLANVTNSNQWYDQMIATVTTAIHATIWQGSEGIITEGDNGPNADAHSCKGEYIRGLYLAWSRYPDNSQLQALIEAYVNVQYNALLDLATQNGTNVYASTWGGPPTTVNPGGELAALPVMAVAIAPPASTTSLDGNSSASGSNAMSSSTSSSRGSTAPSTSNSRHSIAAGAIAGIAVGVLLTITLLGVVAYLYRRTRARPSQTFEPAVAQSFVTIAPQPQMRESIPTSRLPETFMDSTSQSYQIRDWDSLTDTPPPDYEDLSQVGVPNPPAPVLHSTRPARGKRNK